MGRPLGRWLDGLARWLGKSFDDHPLGLLSILQPLETHDEVIGVADQKRSTRTARPQALDEPFVQHFMQVDVA